MYGTTHYLRMFEGEFMQPELVDTTWIRIDGDYGGALIPADLVGGSTDPKALADYYGGEEIYGAEVVAGWAARLSASGYMDCTDWIGVFDSPAQAAKELADMYAPD